MSSLINKLSDINFDCPSDQEIIEAIGPALKSEFSGDTFKASVSYLRGKDSGLNDIVTIFDRLKFDIIESDDDRNSGVLEIPGDSESESSASNNAILSYLDGSHPIKFKMYKIVGLDDANDLPVGLSVEIADVRTLSVGDTYVIRSGNSCYRISGVEKPIIIHRLNDIQLTDFNHYFEVASGRYLYPSFSNQKNTRNKFFLDAVLFITRTLIEEGGPSELGESYINNLVDFSASVLSSNEIDPLSKWRAIQALGLVDRAAAIESLRRIAATGPRNFAQKASHMLSQIGGI